MPQAAAQARSVPKPVLYVCVCRNKHMINFWQMCDTKEMWHTSAGYEVALEEQHKMAAWPHMDATLAGILIAAA